jgi:ABC-type uncharacterized transport system substrate-binding protein
MECRRMPCWTSGRIRLAAALAAFSIFGAGSALSHPHVWVSTESTVVFENGSITALDQRWTFDDMYSAMATQGLDKNGDGKLDNEELDELAKLNMEGLQEYDYFTFPKLADTAIKLGTATNARLAFDKGVLSLNFRVPLSTPVLKEAKGFSFQVYDPSFYIAFEPAKAEPVKLSSGAPTECKLVVTSPAENAASEESRLGQAFSAVLGGASAGLSFAKTYSVDCMGGAK